MTRDSEEEDDRNDIRGEIIARKLTGTVQWFTHKAGYGFITRNDTKEDIFFPQGAVNGCQSLYNGTFVEFDVVIEKSGKPCARNVRALNGTSW